MAVQHFQWWLYVLCVGYCFSRALAETNTSLHIVSDDTQSTLIEDIGVRYSNSTTQTKARSLKCVPMIKLFEVELTEPLKPGEGVGITGDHEKLGVWAIDKSLEMRKRRRNPLKWFLKIPMCTSFRIYYRFFIFYRDSKGFKRLRYWEGQQHSRVLEAYEMYRHQGSQKFGEVHALAVGGGIQIDRGWLRKEYVIQLKFIWPQHIRFTEFSHFIRKPRYILQLKAYGEGKLDTEIQVARFVDKKSQFRDCREQGEFYKPGVVMIFQVIVPINQANLYVLSIYTRQQELLAEVIIPPEVLQRSEGILELPIIDPKEGTRVGWLTLPFLRIEPMPGALQFNMRTGFHHYWPYNWPTLDIGSRGVGKSFYYHSANAIENTLNSFLKAQSKYSDMIQLEVQLTRDYKPVVWHNYGFFTAAPNAKRQLKLQDLLYVLIHDLSYEELLKKRVFVIVKGVMLEVTHLNSPFVKESERIFPLLADIYQHLSVSLGIMVDIKWPQLLSSGSFESLQPLDKNLYVNAVLKATMEYGCGRPIIMASFDADICSMLRSKQHMYPVIFLTIGQHSDWESYADLRTHSLSRALQFVQAADILGSGIYSKEILPTAGNQELVEMAFEMQQRLFVWGDQLKDPVMLEYFRTLELAGLVYDRIDKFMEEQPRRKRKRFGFFEAEELQRIFLRQCIAVGNTSISEGLPDTHSPFWPRLRSLDEL